MDIQLKQEVRNHKYSLNVLKKFRIIYGTVRQHFRDVEQACGISGSQLWMLQEIYRTPNIGVSDLADRISIHQSTCSLLVEKLVSKDLVKKVRDIKDHRRVGLCATDSAIALLSNAPDPTVGVLNEVLMSMPSDVLLEIDNSLEKIITQLRTRNDELAVNPIAEP
ncbi:MAG TPA: MarR family transcriptional regulator [Methylophilaceae bacterium]|nr:MarR family transcriptional regulator [Methylophilaceae bacterium]HAJ71182.1 MarR family transcriptional regulator [Methylophilaceae bacterium]